MDTTARIRWLKIGSAITFGFGILIAAAAIPALQAPTGLLLDLVYFPVDGAQQNDGEAARILSAVTGGVLAGWAAMIWLVATELYPRDPALGRRLILLSVGIWFVIDSSMSIAAGALLNAIFNVGFLLVFVLPVWKPAAPAGAATAA